MPNTDHTAATVPTSYVDAANGVRFAYRSLGEDTGVPLLLLQRFRGTLDDWDPQLLDGLAKTRRVIPFDHVGSGGSSGVFPESIQEAAAGAIAFAEALGLTKVDVLGFSMGSYVAESFAVQRPDLVRRVVLAGSGARSNAANWTDAIRAAAGRDVMTDDDSVFLFFKDTDTSRAAGRAYLKRLESRTGDRVPVTGVESRGNQLKALGKWSAETEEVLGQLKFITQPVFAANGDDDIMVGTANTIDLTKYLPLSQLTIYPDSGHGFLFQHTDVFVDHTATFLDMPIADKA